MSVTIEAIKPYSSYLVEFINFDGHASSRRFDGPNGFENAKGFYDRCGQADFLGLVKYEGYKFIESK